MPAKKKAKKKTAKKKPAPKKPEVVVPPARTFDEGWEAARLDLVLRLCRKGEDFTLTKETAEHVAPLIEKRLKELGVDANWQVSWVGGTNALAVALGNWKQP